MPGNFRYRSFRLVRIFEDHNRLGRDRFAHVLGLLVGEVLFEQVDLVVLADPLLSTYYQVLCRRGITHRRVSDQLFQILLLVALLGVVDVPGPTSDDMLHASVVCGHSLRVHLFM